MSNRPTADFIDILTQSKVPVTEAALNEALKSEVQAAGSSLANDSQMSPFWRWVRSAVVTPVVWMIRTLLAGHIMPNMFVATSERWALELKAWEYNLTPKNATKTVGVMTLTKTSAADKVTINEGAVIQTLPIDGVTYKVLVTQTTVIEAGQSAGKVPVQAEHAGAAYNLPAGYFNILPQGIAGIASAVNEPDWVTTLGADEETDEELALRIQNAFTSSGEWHIDDVYRSMIASVAGIRSDHIFFENTGDITPGTANAYVLMEVGPTPQDIINQLNHYVMQEGHHGHGDVLTCVAIPESEHTIVAQVVFNHNLSDQQKVNELLEVEDRIRASFRETAGYSDMTRARPNSRFSVSQLDTEIHNAMPNVASVRMSVDGQVQQDIVSLIRQPRIKSLTVKEWDDE